ncbi:unnamed protein product [Bursaphelenchus okinawaensis]|uniref:Peptidase C1A papain C-terminal domain-containing protein n=1 Tax=Bursaphelenchus okinawaensis TaxID=465554 RepID=A0A811LE42_9BILA|nr:unnamed protein product [Bursaphelenchus okinawaensis]CAG9120877.1 unnamed protein product [Bursaphelenchus okinawaensis]
MTFANKVVIITGSSSGIGKEAALLFAKKGANVVIHGQNEDRLNETAKEIIKASSSDKVLLITGPIQNEKTWKTIAFETVKKFGRIDVLVNNAGSSNSDTNPKSLECLQACIDVNVKSVIGMTEACIPYLKKTKGNIINISSGLATKIGPATPMYAISKAALEHYTRHAAFEYAEFGVRVNNVAPGITETPFHTRNSKSSNGRIPSGLESAAKNVPLHRMGSAKESAQMIVFAASNRCKPAPLTGRALVDSINKKGLFEAVYDPEALNTRTLGLKIDPNRAVPINNFGFSNDFPTEFDVATNWPEYEFDVATNYPECADIVNNIRDQSKCGSCWAVSAAGAISDRICVATNGSVKVSISSYQAAACAGGDGCIASTIDAAFDTFITNGIPTGSENDKKEGCQPYPFEHCAHGPHSTTYPQCSSLPAYKANQCYHTCQPGYNKSYEDDLYFGTGYHSVESEADAQKAIMANGTLILGFNAYESFLYYNSGIYKPISGEKYYGWHAVRLIGWGEEGESKYWKLANSWNEEWGLNGFFKLDKTETVKILAVDIDTERIPQH